MTIEDANNIIQAFAEFVTTVAIIVAGFWTYFLFIKNRSNYPIINLSLSYKKFDLPKGKYLIHAAIRVENNGLVLLQSSEAEVRLRQVKPLPKDVLDTITNGFDPVPEEDQEVLWPLVSGRRWDWSGNSFEIEPKEHDTLHADFVIDNDVEIVEFYFYLKNSAKTKKQLGWALTSMSELSNKEPDFD